MINKLKAQIEEYRKFRCKHFKSIDEFYTYCLPDNTALILCGKCNRELAEQIMKQLVTEVFIK